MNDRESAGVFQSAAQSFSSEKALRWIITATSVVLVVVLFSFLYLHFIAGHPLVRLLLFYIVPVLLLIFSLMVATTFKRAREHWLFNLVGGGYAALATLAGSIIFIVILLVLLIFF